MAKLPAPEQLITINDIAALCQVSSKTVRRWITADELPAAQLGNQWRIRPADLHDFIQERVLR